VITGGEPTIHNDLEDFIIKIKKLGYKIKLDTNGTNPVALKNLIENNLLDYIAMDIKTAPDKYDIVTGTQPDLNILRKSIKTIMKSNLPYEFRSTLVPALVAKEDIEKMGELLRGAEKWFLQQFKHDTDLVNNDFQQAKKYTKNELEKMRQIGKKYVKICEVR
jgi:pyruvate formate lyase activating enzyme